jgi:hypothetical protein
MGFTLLRLGDLDVDSIPRSAKARRIPLDVLTIHEPDRSALRELYGAQATIIRSDHHVAWRGDQLPDHVDELLDTITGSKAWTPTQHAS